MKSKEYSGIQRGLRLMWLQEIGEESFWKVEIELLLGMGIRLRSKKVRGEGVRVGALGRGQCTCYLKCGKAAHDCPPTLTPAPQANREADTLIGYV